MRDTGPPYGPWDVSPAQVLRLNPAALQVLVTDLVRAEVAFCSRDLAGVRGRAETAASVHGAPEPERQDESIDILVERFDGQSPYVPSGRSTWHVTASEEHAKRASAWARKQIEAPAVQSERERGAHTVLVLVARTHATQSARLEKVAGRVKVLDTDKIAAWATRHNFNVRLGPNSGVQSLEQALESMPGGTIPFQWAEDRLAAKERIWSYLRGESPSPIHIEGAAGIGKTRLALETLRNLTGFRERVVYVRDGHWTPGAATNDLLRRVESDPERTAILLLDECDHAHHRRWVEQLRPLNARSTRVWLISISTSAPPGEDDDSIGIDRLADHEISRFLRASYQLPDEALTAIVEACRGFVKAAVFLSDYVTRNPLRVRLGDWANRADRESLFLEALGDDAELVGPAALLVEVTQQDIEILARELDLAAAEIERAISRLWDKGLLQPRVDAHYLTPEILADTLALRQVRYYRSGDRLVRLFEQLAHRGRLAMLERLVRLRSDADVERLLQNILTKIGSSGTPPAGPGAGGEYLAILAIALPRQALAAALRWIEGVGLASAGDVRPDLSSLVRVLEILAHRPEFFEEAASGLATIAEAETRFGDGGPATKRWTALFSFGLARTEASNTQRLRALSSAASHARVARRALAMRAAARMISYPGGVSLLSDKLVVARPSDGADVGPLFETAWKVLLAGLADEEVIAVIATSGIQDNFKYSLRVAAEPVLTVIEAAPLGTRRVSAALQSVLAMEQFSPNNGALVRSRLSALAKRLEGTSFGSRLRYWVGEGSSRGVGGEGFERSVRAWTELAQMVVEEPALLAAEREWLSSPEASSGFSFGKALGTADVGLRLLPALEDWVNARGGGLVIAGYLHGALEVAPIAESPESILDRWALRGGHFAHAVSEVTWRGRATERALRRWLRIVRAGEVPPEVLSLAIWGDWHLLPGAAITEMLSCAHDSGNAAACAGALTVAARWQEAHSPAEECAGLVEEGALAVVRAVPGIFSAGGAPAITASQALDDVLMRLSSRSPERAAETLIDLLRWYGAEDSRLVELLSHVVEREPRAVLPLIEERLLDAPELREEVLDHLHDFVPAIFDDLGKRRARTSRYLVLDSRVSAPA